MDYNLTFENNIKQREYNGTINGILSWIKENRDKFDYAKDPNAYEMTNVFLFGAKYAIEGLDIEMDTLDEIWEIRSQDFTNCGISENNSIYAICRDSYMSAKNKRPLVNDENSHHALRKMAGIGLWLKQQKRDGQELHYDNLHEFQVLLETSKTLKAIHPDLFEKYQFPGNITVIYKLLEKTLDKETKQELLESKNELLEGSKNELNKKLEVKDQNQVR